MIKLFGRSQLLRRDELIEVYREPKETTYVEGRKIATTKPIEFQIRANVQPINGRDLMMVPEHDRYRENLYVWTDNSKPPGDADLASFPIGTKDFPGSLQVNDRVLRLGVKYQVQSVENWGSFCRTRITRIDVGPERNR